MQTEPTITKDVLSQVSDLCRRGFSTGDTDPYGEIVELLRPFEGDERVASMIRLAGAWPELTSKRFAYPHIESAADSLSRSLTPAPAPKPY